MNLEVTRPQMRSIASHAVPPPSLPVLAEVVLLQCKKTARLCSSRLQSHLAIGSSLLAFSVRSVKSAELFPQVAEQIVQEGPNRRGNVIVFVIDSDSSFEDGIMVAEAVENLRLGHKCAVLFVDSLADLGTPHQVMESETSEAAAVSLHRIVARSFSPQEDAPRGQEASFFADCTSAYSAAAKFVFHLDVFQKPYCWFILRQALCTPDNVAVEDGIGGSRTEEKSLTYAQFVSASISLAEQMQREPFGVAEGTRVAILMEKGVDWLTAILACNILGAPFTIFDTRLNGAQAKHAWQIFEPSLVICRNRAAVARFVHAFTDDEGGEMFGRISTMEFSVTLASSTATLPIAPSEIALWMGRCAGLLEQPVLVDWTSGTSGKPKGTLHKNKVLTMALFWRLSELPCMSTQHDDVLAINLFGIWYWFYPLAIGMKTVVLPDELLYDHEELIHFFAKKRVTRWDCTTPTLLQAVVQYGRSFTGQDTAEGQAYAELVRMLKVATVGGEPLKLDLVQLLLGALPNTSIVNILSRWPFISPCASLPSLSLPLFRFPPVSRAPPLHLHLLLL
jgi:hypothetical protein